jgi:hypothetical protein
MNPWRTSNLCWKREDHPWAVLPLSLGNRSERPLCDTATPATVSSQSSQCGSGTVRPLCPRYCGHKDGNLAIDIRDLPHHFVHIAILHSLHTYASGGSSPYLFPFHTQLS